MLTEKMKKEIKETVKNIIRKSDFNFQDIGIEVADYDAVSDLIDIDEDADDFDRKRDAAVREINEYGSDLLKKAERIFCPRTQCEYVQELKKEFLNQF